MRRNDWHGNRRQLVIEKWRHLKQGHREWEFPGMYSTWNCQQEFPEVLKIFQNCHFFWILIFPYYVKPVFFILCFGKEHWTQQWAVVPHFEFMKPSNDLLINKLKLVQHHCQYELRKYNVTDRVIPLWNSYQLLHHRRHRQVTVGYVQWES